MEFLKQANAIFAAHLMRHYEQTGPWADILREEIL